MSNSDTSTAQNTDNATDQSTEPTPTSPSFAQQVDTVVSSMTKDAKGVLQFPEGEFSEELRYAAMAEKRRKDTHGSFTQSRQELAKTRSERDSFRDKLAKQVTPTLTAEQTSELEQLKFSDPDAWRAKIGEYEHAAQTELDTTFEEVSKTAQHTSELAQREDTLADFQRANPEFDLIDDDVPPRISKKLDSGEISFEDFLNEVHTYNQTPKKVYIAPKDDEPNLANVAGNSSPQDRATQHSVETEYANSDIF